MLDFSSCTYFTLNILPEENEKTGQRHLEVKSLKLNH